MSMSDGPLPATEATSPRFSTMDAWPSHDILDVLLEGQMAAVAAVRPALAALAAAADAAAERFREGGRLAYAGAGTSGRIGVQDGAELAPTFDWPRDRLVFLMAGGDAALTQAVENAEDRDDLARRDVATAGLGAPDVIVGVAASGTTPYTLACLQAAGSAGALTIAIANSPGAPLLAAADHAILIETGAEPIAGSTRMKAGTSQKVALNLFSTLLMTRLGRVYQGQMVDMVARNDKLRARAIRMLQGLTGCTPEAAVSALSQAGGTVKIAVLILRGLSRQDADELLARHQGQLRKALSAF